VKTKGQTERPGEVIGGALRRLRRERGLTQEQVALKAQDAGLPWTADTVAGLELGRREDLTVGELLVLTTAMDIKSAVDWFREADWVQATPYVCMDQEAVVSILEGRLDDQGRHFGHGQVDYRNAPRSMVIAGLVGLFRPTDAEFNAAGRLGVRVDAIMAAAQHLWDGRRLDEERDRRLGSTKDMTPNERRARRGRVTRALLGELRAALDESGSSIEIALFACQQPSQEP
jgi:transcriptional regulator with XRE-family HTH domain